MTTYLVEVAVDMLRAIEDTWDNRSITGWRLLEKVRDLPEYGYFDGGIELWKAEDDGAGPEFEGKLVEPEFRLDSLSSGKLLVVVTGRTIRGADPWYGHQCRLTVVPWRPGKK